MFIEKELGYKRHWINIDSDIVSEQSYLYTKYDIDQETVEYALDKNERAHMDYNRENGTNTRRSTISRGKRTRNTMKLSL